MQICCSRPRLVECGARTRPGRKCSPHRTYRRISGLWSLGRTCHTTPARNQMEHITTVARAAFFLPGRYSFAPPWAANNYMKSGDYYFDLGSTISAAAISIDHAVVTAGREGEAGDQQEIDNPACNTVRDADFADGATFYLDSATHITVGERGSLEILRRTQGTDFVSIHALPTHDLGTTYDNSTHGSGGDGVPDILSTLSGNNKQMAIHAYIWAPFGTLGLGEVTQASAAQLLGGAVAAALRADASASAEGFVIQVQGNPQDDRYRLTATATKNSARTQVSVIAQLRYAAPESGGGVGFWELAINSWRCQRLNCRPAVSSPGPTTYSRRMSWEQLSVGVELPFADDLTIPELHEYALDVPSPPADHRHRGCCPRRRR